MTHHEHNTYVAKVKYVLIVVSIVVELKENAELSITNPFG
jgi:hypothetical protein